MSRGYLMLAATIETTVPPLFRQSNMEKVRKASRQTLALSGVCLNRHFVLGAMDMDCLMLGNGIEGLFSVAQRPSDSPNSRSLTTYACEQRIWDIVVFPVYVCVGFNIQK